MVDVQKVIRTLRDYFLIDNSPIARDDDRIEEIYQDGSVDINGNVKMIHPAEGNLIPVKFNLVHGFFQAENVGLNNLENAPSVCSGLFVRNNGLRNFEYCPYVASNIDIGNNNFQNFLGLPTENLETLDATGNPLRSLQGLPEKVSEEPLSVSITYRQSLPLLRLLVATDINVYRHGSKREPYEPVQSILRKYAGQGIKAMYDCQKDLIDVDCAENARW